MVRFNDKPQIENSALSDTDIMPITDLEDSASDKKISIGQLKEYLSENLTNFADIDLVNTDMLADAIIEAPNGVIVANSSNNAIIAKQGLKLLFANGRKANNKFNNLEYTLENDISQSVVSMANGNYVVFLTSAGSLGYIPITEIYISSEQPQVSTPNAYWYDVISNYWKRTSTSGATWVNTIINILGQVTITNNLLTTVTPNTLAYIPIPETLTIRDLSNITTAGEKRIKDLVQPNINTAVNNASNTINARIDSVNSNLQTQISKNRADINTLDVGGAIEKTPSKLKTALLLSTIMDKPISDVDIYNVLEQKKRSTFDRSKFTVIGSPTITDDGIASGFTASGSNRLLFNVNTTNATDLSIKYKFKHISNAEGHMFLLVGSGVWDEVVNFYVSANGNAGNARAFGVSAGSFGASAFNINDDYEMEFTITDYNKYDWYIRNLSQGTIHCHLQAVNTEERTKEASYLWFTQRTGMTIDLKQCSITVDGIEVFNGNKTGIDQIKKDDYTKHGNVVVSEDGIASGGQIQKNVSYDNIDSFRQTLSIRYKSAGEGVNQQILYLYGASTSTNTTQIEYIVTDTSFSIARRYNGVWGRPVVLTTNFIDGDLIDVDAEFTQTEIKYSIYKNGILIANDIKAVASSPFKIETIALSATYSYIDLNSYKFYLNNNLVYQPTLRIPYTQSKTDEKIVDAVYRDRVQDMYEQFGYTHYYTIGDVPEKYNVQVVGNPTLADGVASGFSSSNYLTISKEIMNNAIGKPFKLEWEDVLSTITSSPAYYVFGRDGWGTNPQSGQCITIGNINANGNFFAVLSDGTKLHPPYINGNLLTGGGYRGKKYKGEIIFDGSTTFTLKMTFEDGKVFEQSEVSQTQYTMLAFTNDLYVGWSNSQSSFNLNALKFYIDGKEVFRGYESAIVDAYTLATHRNSDIIETFSDNAGTYYEVRADLVQRCVGIIPPQTTQVNYPRAFREDKNIVQVSYFDVGDSTSTLTLDHIAPKTQTKAGFTIGSTQTANRNYYAEGKAVLG